MTTGAWILVAAVALALALGLWRAGVDGRFRGSHRVRGAGGDESGAESEAQSGAESGAEGRVASSAAEVVAQVGAELGERATLLQFSSAFCAPCRVTRRILADAADTVPGVVHVEIDAEHHLAAVRTLGVLRTPTTIVLDAAGVEVTRAAGAPKREQVLSAIASVS